MNWYGYIKGDGKCLITPLPQDHEDVMKWWTGDGRRSVTALDGGMEAAMETAKEAGAKSKDFVLHNPPHIIMTPSMKIE